MSSASDELPSRSSSARGWYHHGGYVAAKMVGARRPPDFDASRRSTRRSCSPSSVRRRARRGGAAQRYGGDRPGAAGVREAARPAIELGHGRCAAARRRGPRRPFRLAYFKPASGLTPELIERYEKNRLTVTRQLPYEANSTKTLDLCLFVNGIPVATAELKNPITGQTRRARPSAVPHGPGPEEPAAASGDRALRRRHRGGVDDDPARRATGPGSCRSTVATRWVPGTRRTRTGIARRTCGSRCGSGTPGSTCCSGSCTSSRRPKGSKARPVVIFPGTTSGTPCGR